MLTLEMRKVPTAWNYLKKKKRAKSIQTKQKDMSRNDWKIGNLQKQIHETEI